MGSTTERLLRHSPVPMLVISAARKSSASDVRFRRILVTTDLSKDTVKAVKYAVSIAQNNQSHVTVLNVLDEVRAFTSKDYRNQLSRKVQSRLSRMVSAGGRNLAEVETRVEAGTPYHVILMMLKKEKFDLLVMNTHGKGMLDRALLGSTTERVVRGAACPVLLIPPDKTRK
jgi:nucleotide-binding universal stress UspA family protein